MGLTASRKTAIKFNRYALKKFTQKHISADNNGKMLTVSQKLAKILTFSRKSCHPIEIHFSRSCFRTLTISNSIFFFWQFRDTVLEIFVSIT